MKNTIIVLILILCFLSVITGSCKSKPEYVDALIVQGNNDGSTALVDPDADLIDFVIIPMVDYIHQEHPPESRPDYEILNELALTGQTGTEQSGNVQSRFEQIAAEQAEAERVRAAELAAAERARAAEQAELAARELAARQAEELAAAERARAAELAANELAARQAAELAAAERARAAELAASELSASELAANELAARQAADLAAAERTRAAELAANELAARQAAELAAAERARAAELAASELAARQAAERAAAERARADELARTQQQNAALAAGRSQTQNIAGRNTNIIGPGSLNVDGVLDYIKARNKNPVRNERYIKFLIEIYMEEAAVEDVNHDIAIAQMLYWTAFFSNRQRVDSNNFGGLERTRDWNGSFPRHLRDSGDIEGIRAHIQHLRGYSSTSLKSNTTRNVDPRWDSIRHINGNIKTFDQLYQRWSPNVTRYRYNINIILDNLYQYSDKRR